MQAIFQVLYIPHGQCRYRIFLSLHKVLLDHTGLDFTAGPLWLGLYCCDESGEK